MINGSKMKTATVGSGTGFGCFHSLLLSQAQVNLFRLLLLEEDMLEELLASPPFPPVPQVFGLDDLDSINNVSISDNVRDAKQQDSVDQLGATQDVHHEVSASGECCQFDDSTRTLESRQEHDVLGSEKSANISLVQGQDQGQGAYVH